MNIDHSYLKNRKGTKARKREKIKNKIERDEKKKKRHFMFKKSRNSTVCQGTNFTRRTCFKMYGGDFHGQNLC